MKFNDKMVGLIHLSYFLEFIETEARNSFLGLRTMTWGSGERKLEQHPD